MRSEQRDALPATQELPARPGAERVGGEVQHVEMLSREEEEGYEGAITSPVDGEDGAGSSCSSLCSWRAAGKTFQTIGLR